MVTIGAGHLASEALNSMLPAWPHATEAGQDRCPLESGLHTMQTAYANKGEQHEDTIAREVREETTLIGGLDGLTLDPREVLEARLFSLADLPTGMPENRRELAALPKTDRAYASYRIGWFCQQPPRGERVSSLRTFWVRLTAFIPGTRAQGTRAAGRMC
jgi:hypothetical protein